MERNKQLYVLIAAVGLVAVLLSTCVGALAGGTVGYWAGCKASQRIAEEYLDLLQEWSRQRIQTEEPQLFPPERLPFAPGAGGVLVTAVVDGSPADRAGIEAEDWIIAVDGVAVDEHNSLERLIRRYRPGDGIVITLWGNGRERRVRVRLGEHPEDRDVAYLGVYYQVPSMRVEPPDKD
jgi:membrane-associated protease RseP (regulator of RpoE activity)